MSLVCDPVPCHWCEIYPVPCHVVCVQDPDLLGEIKIHEMLSISRCSDESTRDPKYSHCFEVYMYSP